MTLLLLAAALINLGQVPSRADDFAFRLEYGLCSTEVLDTFQGVFIHDMGSTKPPVSIALTLPQEALDTVYQRITSARFFDYPSDFEVKPVSHCELFANGSASCGGWITGYAPANHYRLMVRNGAVQHVVKWVDGGGPSNEEADRLRAMFTAIIAIISGLPELQRLPSSGIGCG